MNILYNYVSVFIELKLFIFAQQAWMRKPPSNVCKSFEKGEVRLIYYSSQLHGLKCDRMKIQIWPHEQIFPEGRLTNIPTVKKTILGTFLLY